MKKTYGVCIGLLAMGITVLVTPAARAQSRLAAGEPGAASETSATSTATSPSAPAASSPADLDQRIGALEAELASLKSELAEKKEAEAAAPITPAVAVATPQDKAPEKVTVASLLGPTSLSGFVDTYYTWNSNHPIDNSVALDPFGFRSKSISLNMVELILDKAPDPMGGAAGRTGYHVSLGFGDAMNTVNASDPAGLGFAQYLKEAYFSYLAPVGKGLQIDVGKFVTPMGAEVIESKDNWNYSRGILFAYAIPYYHFGARAKYTFNDKFNLTGYFVNGWNNVVDNNTGKTYGFSAAFTPTKKNMLTINYLAGPEENESFFLDTGYNANDFWRQTWDIVYMYNLTSKLTFMANYDYAHGDRFVINSSTTPETLSSPLYVTGIAGYLKYAFNDNNYVAARYEYFNDRYGIAFGVPQNHVQEFTATYSRTLATHLLTRFEYRYDNSMKPLFELADFVPRVNSQNTLTMGLIFLFDSRDAK